MQSIPERVSPIETDEGDFGPGMTLIARGDGQNWNRGAKGVICARRVAEMLPPLGPVTLYVVLFDTGLQSELTAIDLRRFFMVSLDIHPGFKGYEFRTTRELHVDFYAGRFGSIFRRKRSA
jgi:hypothetical protein